MSKGIPTMYRGVRFRSRLEARWAVWFDAVGWGWAYEPFDLDGYIPDFALRLDKELVVEIKPAISPEEMKAATFKVDASGWNGEALILGAALLEIDAVQPVLGLLRNASELGCEWSPARLFECISCGKTSFLSEDWSWHCRVCGEGYGNSHIGQVADLTIAWAAAGNRVQWRPSA